MTVSFIAEVSSNHGCDLDRSLSFIDMAADIGCDSVKFQLFKIDEMFAPEILERSAVHRARREWELPIEFLEPLSARCHERGLTFSCTPFYLAAVETLEPYVDFYKIASYEMLWDDLLRSCARTGKPIVLSTGMATLPEIGHAADVLHHSGARDVTLLHCVSAYPTPVEEVNLAAIRTIADLTGFPVGWSDHSVNAGVISRAVHHWNARTIEFHLDLDASGAEYASGHCWLPEPMKDLIADIRSAFSADGSGMKQPSLAELADRDWRADPSDGLRPLRHVRDEWEPGPEHALDEETA